MKAWTIQGSLNIECVLERNEESIIKHSDQMAIWSLLLLLQGEFLPSPGHAWLLHHKIIWNLPLFNDHSFTCSLLCSANKTNDFPLPRKSAHQSPSVTELSRAPPSAFPVKSRKTYTASSFVTSLDANSTERTFHGHSICKIYPCVPSRINLIFSFQVIIIIYKVIVSCFNACLPCYCFVCPYKTSQYLVQWMAG